MPKLPGATFCKGGKNIEWRRFDIQHLSMAMLTKGICLRNSNHSPTFSCCIFEDLHFTSTFGQTGWIETVPLQVKDKLAKIQGCTGLNSQFEKVKMENTHCNFLKKKRPKRFFFSIALRWWMVSVDTGQWLDVLPRLSIWLPDQCCWSCPSSPSSPWCLSISSSCSFRLRPELHISESRNFLLFRQQKDHHSWLSQRARSWSQPGRGLAG